MISTLLRKNPFRAAKERGWAKKAYSLKSVTHIQQLSVLALLYLSKRRSKKYINHVAQPLSSDINIFSPKISNFCCMNKYGYRFHFNTLFLILIAFLWVFKGYFNNNRSNLTMSTKLGTLGHLDINVFWNKDYDIMIFVHHVNNKDFIT